jgi:tRNA (guanosine-2'-O-)-methyltransferase
MTPERQQRIETVLSKRHNTITVILENVHDPHNISAVMRTADAIGCKEIFVINTKIARHEKWGSKSSSSAHKWLQVHQFDNLATGIAAVRQQYNSIYATHLSSSAISLYELPLTQSIALAFGNESIGLSDEFLALTDGNFIIPQVGMIQSLNISVACAISLYEGMRQKLVAGDYNNMQLSTQHQAELISYWEQQQMLRHQP